MSAPFFAPQSAVSDALKKLPDNQGETLDPSNAADRAMILAFLELGGRSPERYPALHAALDRAMDASVAYQAKIVDLGRDANGNASSRTWVGFADMPVLSGAITAVLDAETHSLLALGSSSTVGEGLTQVATRPVGPATSRQTAVSMFYAMNKSGLPTFGAISRTASNAATAQASEPTITAPVISISGHSTIVIGLNRPQGQNPDCDYNFLEDAPQSNPPLLVPFVGSFSLPFNITGIGSDGQIAGLTVNSVIYVALSAGQQSPPLLPDALPLSCTSSLSAQNVISWSFPYTDPQEPIIYLAASTALDTKSAFMFQFSVPVDDPSSPYVFTICSYDTPGQPSVQCFQIPDLQFTWHCVAAGTLVTLADGSTVKIDETTNKHRVKTGFGGDLAIEANWRGTHEGSALEIVTAGGLKLAVTPDHPVQTPAGLVVARDLKIGSHVIAGGGTIDTITALDAMAGGGLFWNLMLGDADDRAAGVATGACTYIANGIVVGDFQALAGQYRASRRNYDYMRARLPETLHKDYESALADLS